MSLIDTRFPDLDLFLQRWQRRLNTQVSTGAGLAAWLVVCPVAAGAAFVAFQDPTARLVLWSGTTALATLAFVLWRRRLRLSRHQAGSWLDEQAPTQGLFRAASECLDRDHPSASEAQVLAEATRRSIEFRGPQRPHLPWRRLAWRWALVLGLSGLAVSGLSLVPAIPGLSLAPRDPNSAPSAQDVQPGTQGPESRELTPHEAAQRLFPEDARLAALAEQALASGDPGALEALLAQNTESSPSGAAPSGGTAPGQGQQGDGGQAGTPGGEPPSSSEKGSPGGKGQSEGSRSGEKKDQGPDAPSGTGRTSGGKGQDPGDNEGGQTPGSLGQPPGAGRPGPANSGDKTPLSSGGAPGFGHSEQPLGPRPSPGSSTESLVLKEQKNPGVFEYVLPGTGPQLPSTRVLADSRRSAETIISRTSPPLEFENTIRDYFLSLSAMTEPKETSP